MSSAPPIGHNSGVSPDVAIEAMKNALAPWQERRAEFEAKAKIANVDCHDAAQAAIDFIRMARALRDKAENLLAETRKPYRDAADAAKGIADQFIDSIDRSTNQMRTALDAYNADRKAKAKALEDAQREAERLLAQKAAERDGGPVPQIPQGAPRRRKAAPIRTDLGGVMVEQDRWRVEVTDPTLVPAFILKSPKVVDAIRIVARDFIKNGMDVPGCEKIDFTATTIS